ncbi:MAG: hypothetical protein HXX81_08175 [Campylobacterales bacterium]|nr:hypothetical protein [Campylobacterales bacterium]
MIKYYYNTNYYNKNERQMAENSIYNLTLAFLEKNIDFKFYCEDFNNIHTKMLYDYLSLNKYTIDDITNQKESIRKAFKTFFQKIEQQIALFFDDSLNIVVKDINKKQFGKHTKTAHLITNQIQDLKSKIDLIEPVNNVILIEDDILKNIKFDNSLEHKMKKELLKYSLKKGLNLDARDIVFFLNDKVAIKKFMYECIGGKKHTILERRSNGLPAEELEKIKQKVFEQNIWDQMQKKIKLLMEYELNFTEISNEAFHKNYIKILQQEINSLILKYLDDTEDEIVKKSFSSYLLRENFEKIHYLFAEELLELCTNRNKNAENFIKFYNGDVIVIDGKKIQKPEILDENNQKWNAVNVLPILIQRKKDLKELEKIENDLTTTKKELIDTQEEHAQKLKELEYLKEDKIKIREDIKKVISESKESQDTIYDKKTDIKRKNKDITESEQNEINKISYKIKQLHKSENELTEKEESISKQIDSLYIKIDNLNRDITQLKRKINDEERLKEDIIERYRPIDEKYQIVKKALVRVLSKKFF